MLNSARSNQELSQLSRVSPLQLTPRTLCWGAELTGDSSRCTPGFEPGHAHFKNKFCAACRNCVEVPAERVRALTPELQPMLTNNLRAGFWKSASQLIGGGLVRVVNNTNACEGPYLAVYREPPPPLNKFEWGELPAEWVSNGYVQLCVAKGTLVPPASLWHPASGNTRPKRQRRNVAVADAGAAANKVAAVNLADASVADVADAAAADLERVGPGSPLGLEQPSTCSFAPVAARHNSGASAVPPRHDSSEELGGQALRRLDSAQITEHGAREELQLPGAEQSTEHGAGEELHLPGAELHEQARNPLPGSTDSTMPNVTAGDRLSSAELGAHLIGAYTHLIEKLRAALNSSPEPYDLTASQRAVLREQLRSANIALAQAQAWTRLGNPDATPRTVCSWPASDCALQPLDEQG